MLDFRSPTIVFGQRCATCHFSERKTEKPRWSNKFSLWLCKTKMEAASAEPGAKNHLNDVLSETEIASLPNPVVEKINVYIDKKFEDYLTSKALHETSKSNIGKEDFNKPASFTLYCY